MMTVLDILKRISNAARVIAAVAFCLGLLQHEARAAGPFDGEWRGGVAYEVLVLGCRSNIIMTVNGKEVSGEQDWRNGIASISGKIKDDGSFEGRLVGNTHEVEFKGVFGKGADGGLEFKGNFPSPNCGLATVTLKPSSQ